MARGTLFGEIHSNRDLHLIQQTVEITPAAPKTNYKDIPGANGSKDMTEALGVGIKYEDAEIKWTFALYPGDDWAEAKSRISNAINGRAMHIVMDDDPSWYYDGRVTVENYKSDKTLHQITVSAVCRPYKRKLTESIISRTDLTSSYKNCVCEIGAMPLIPEITVDEETSLKWDDIVVTITAGTHIVPELLMSGNQTIKAKLTSAASGAITIKWREGSQ